MSYYSYWESFVEEWIKGEKAIMGWTNPDEIPLYGSENIFSSEYIPEPWWGNDGNHILNSVVMNFNPGKGYDAQLKDQIPYKGSYANDIVNSGILPINDRWQWIHRAYPVLASLQRLGFKTGYPCLREHLSVELIPWRTPIVDKDYDHYLQLNIKEVFDNSICFAAQESHRIENDKLRDVVLLRMREAPTTYLLNQLKEAGQDSSIIRKKQKTSSGNGAFLEFSLKSLPNVRFISVWGSKSRNNFPPPTDMDEIIQSI